MADTTPVLLFPFPEPADAADGPGAIQALADRVEDVLVPAGLSSGQGLVYDGADWVPESIATADALAAHAADTTAIHGIADTAKLPRAASESNLGLLRGIVNANGTIAEGTGFTVSKTATGSYTVTYNVGGSTPFTDVAAVTGTPVIRDEFSLQSASASAFAVKIQESDGADIDGAFHFWAIGPVS